MKMLNSKNIDLILNLTIPQAHYEGFEKVSFIRKKMSIPKNHEREI